jgi:hypothetical protein
LREGGNSGSWTGHPLPLASEYVGKRAELLARNRWSWNVTGNVFAEGLLATLARCWRYGCPEPALRYDLLAIGEFAGDRLVHSSVPRVSATIPGARPDDVPAAPPADSEEAKRLDQEAAELRSLAAGIRDRAGSWRRLASAAQRTFDSVSDPVNKEVWKETVDRETAEAERLEKQAAEFEAAAATKAAKAATIRATLAVPLPVDVAPAPDERLHAAQAAKFGNDFRLAVLSVLDHVSPGSLQLVAADHRSLAYPFNLPPRSDELALDAFDMANAALDVILWHDERSGADAGWLEPVAGEGGGGGWGDLAHVLAFVASGATEFGAPGPAIGERQAAIACKAFEVLRRLADADAIGGEAFERELAGILVAGGVGASQRAAGKALLATGFATPELAKTIAYSLVLNAIGSSKDRFNVESAELRARNDFFIDTVIRLSVAAGGPNRPAFRDAFTDEITSWITTFRELRVRGGSFSPEQSHFVDRWDSRDAVIAGLGQPSACTAAPAVVAEKENMCKGPANPDLLTEDFNRGGPVAPRPHPPGRIFKLSKDVGAGALGSYIPLYLFYLGRLGRSDDGRATWPSDAVIIAEDDDNLTQLQQQSQLRDFRADVPTILRRDASVMFKNLRCGQTGRFSDRGSETLFNDPEAMTLTLAFGSYTAYWEASCEVGPKRCCAAQAQCTSGVGHAGLQTCKIKWTLFKLYNFGQYGTGTGGTWWVKQSNPLGWFGVPYQIFGYWDDVANGRHFQCTAPDGRPLEPAPDPG